MRQAIAVILLFVSAVASAAPVTWTVNDFVFDDGGTATGSFVYDADNNTFSDISVTTTSGSAFGGADYNSTWNQVVNGSNGVVLAGYEPSTPNAAILTISLTEHMTNSGGTIQLVSDARPEITCFNSCGFPPPAPERYLLSGNISAVPIPAAVYLFGSGLGLLGWFRRKKA